MKSLWGKDKGIFVAFWVLIILVIGIAIVMMQCKPQLGRLIHDEDCDWSADWNFRDELGNECTVSLPVELKTEIDTALPYSISKVLPLSVPNGTYLFELITYARCECYIGDELRAVYDDADVRIFGRVPVTGYFRVPLSPRDGGKTVRLVITDTYDSCIGHFDSVYMGQHVSVLENQLLEKMPTFFMALIFVFMGIILGTIGLVIYINSKAKIQVGLFYFGVALLFYGMEPLYSSQFVNYFLGNVYSWYFIYRFTNFFLAVPLLMFFDEFLERKYSKLYRIAEIINITIGVVAFVLQFTNVLDLFDMQYAKDVGLVIALVVIMVSAIGEMKSENRIKRNAMVFTASVFLLDAAYQIVSELFLRNLYSFNWMYPAIVLGASVIASTAIRELVDKIQAADMENKAKSEFMAKMSHEIRTPITAIMGMNEMILRETAEEQTKEYAGHIQDASTVLLAIVNSILDISKIEAGKLEIVENKYSVGMMLKQVIELSAPQIKTQKLLFDVQVDEHIPSFLYGDEVRISQILMNLINNAIKYTSEGSIRLSVEGVGEKNSVITAVRFAVEDSGIGIRTEDMDRLFVTFERIKNDKMRYTDGVGLGLALSQQLAMLMGSEIHVESDYGKGSCFWFVLKQRVIDAAPLGNFDEFCAMQVKLLENYTGRFIAPSARVLVVDDNEVNLMIIKGLLKGTAICVDTVLSGEECLKASCQNYYDLIFMDQLMPKMNGVETYQKLRALKASKNPMVPVIALTADAIEGAKEQYLRYGFIDYLTKPVDPKLLEDTLVRYLPKNLLEML